jgi:hypothetical protein
MDIKIGYKKRNGETSGIIIRIDEKDGYIFTVDAKTGMLFRNQAAILKDFTPGSLVFLGVDYD